MADELNVGCARPTGGPTEEMATEGGPKNDHKKKEETTMIRVGKKAPDFTASGYQNGQFITTKLSENLGKWVLLCFYPGDFTFV